MAAVELLLILRQYVTLLYEFITKKRVAPNFDLSVILLTMGFSFRLKSMLKYKWDSNYLGTHHL